MYLIICHLYKYLNNMFILNLTNEYFCMFSGIMYLNETNVTELINRCKSPDLYRDNNELLCALYQVFSTPATLGNSFIKPRFKKHLLKYKNGAKADSNYTNSMTKERVSMF